MAMCREGAEKRILDHPEYRTLVGVDIEGYGSEERTDLMRVRLRRNLSRWCTGLIEQSGADREDLYEHSRGDGFLYSIDPRVPRDVLLVRLIGGLRRRLAIFNRGRPLHERLRLRLALHGGDVLRDPEPFEGKATVLTCRLLDAEELRDCLRSTEESLAVIVSPAMYEGIIRHGYSRIDPDGWVLVPVRTKQGLENAWIHIAGDPEAPERAGVIMCGHPAGSASHQPGEPPRSPPGAGGRRRGGRPTMAGR